ncbi:MAG TPA: hypothetical protein VJC21_01890 [Candidatus Nanoarchaeia archaeon]|nr:hypothetical protein [Candidatus Nanoarchaeia archaeon]
MPLPRKKALQEKGWNPLEIKRAEAVLEHAKEHDLFFSKIVFWSALLVIVFANLAVTLILIPFLVVLNHWTLYGIIVLLAGMVGFLYNFLIADIGYLEKRHHRFASVLIPLIAFANVAVMVFAANRFMADLRVQNAPHDPFVISLIFGVAFILPYVLDQIRLLFQRRTEA